MMGDDPREFYSHLRVGHNRSAKYSASEGALNSTLHSWARSACPFEETRHSCYYINQSNADEVADRAAAMMPSSVRTVELLRRLAGRDIVFVGDSVMRQLAEALMCRLHRQSPLIADARFGSNFRWTDPTKRRHPQWSFLGYCPFARGKHCELERGCAAFRFPSGVSPPPPPPPPPPHPDKGKRAVRAASTRASPEDSGRDILRVCYINSDRINKGSIHGGWEMLHHAQWRTMHESTAAGSPRERVAFFVFHSGHHHRAETMWHLWGGQAPALPPAPLPPPSPSTAGAQTVSMPRLTDHQTEAAPRAAAALPAASASRECYAIGGPQHPPACRDLMLAIALNHSRAIGSKLIFVEHEEQHFPGGGAYDAARHRGGGPLRQCAPLDTKLDAQRRRMVDVERALVHPYVRSVGGIILPTNQLSADAWWAHTYSVRTPSNTADCTHWCMPGIPDVVAGKLMAAMLSADLTPTSPGA